MSAGDDQSRQSDLAVMDASEYKQKRRLQRILDAHDDVEEISEAAYEAYANGEISEAGKNITILRAVQQYVREVHTMLMEYLAELEDGEEDHYWVGIDDDTLGVIQRESEPPIVFTGLRDILSAQPVYNEHWQEQVTTRHGPNRTVEKTATHTVPEEVSMAAYLRTNEFLTHERSIVGVEFEEEGLPTWGFEEIDTDELGEDVVDTAELARQRRNGESDE